MKVFVEKSGTSRCIPRETRPKHPLGDRKNGLGACDVNNLEVADRSEQLFDGIEIPQELSSIRQAFIYENETDSACESFNSKLRDEFLNGEIFYSMKEIRILAERWGVHYNTIRPHSSLGYRSPASESWQK